MKRFIYSALTTACIVGLADLMLVMAVYIPQNEPTMNETSEYQVITAPYVSDAIHEYKVVAG